MEYCTKRGVDTMVCYHIGGVGTICPKMSTTSSRPPPIFAADFLKGLEQCCKNFDSLAGGMTNDNTTNNRSSMSIAATPSSPVLSAATTATTATTATSVSLAENKGFDYCRIPAV